MHEYDLVLTAVLCMSSYAFSRLGPAGLDATCGQGILVAADLFMMLPILGFHVAEGQIGKGLSGC